jgi:LiaF transmembrane domain
VASFATPPRRRHVMGPIILLSVGILLLLNNLDLVPWSIWRDIWPYWPLLLVLLGIEAFITGRVAWGTLVMLIVLLPLVGLAVNIGSYGARWNDATSAAPDRRTSTLRQTLNGATSAALAIEYGVGALDVGPITGDTDNDVLVNGEVFGHGAAGFDTRYDVRDGRGTLRVSGHGNNGAIDPGRLALRLSPNVPLDLQVNAGASDTTLNLADLQVPSLSLETGASRSRVILPTHGQTSVRIEGGAAAITLEVPTNVAAQITVDDAPNALQIDETRFPRNGRDYRSPNFDTATDRVTIRLNVGASRVVVQ